MSNEAVASRRVALNALQHIEKGAMLAEVFTAEGAEPALAKLPERDRAFVRRIVTTTLRHRGEIDAIIKRCLDRPLPKTAERRHNILRLGIAQLLFADIAPHAAVDTTVRLEGTARLRGFINAVLRRVVREAKALLAEIDRPRANTSEWLWRSWCAAYGEETAHAIATAHLDNPPLDLTLKDRSPASIENWARRLGATVMPWGSLRLPDASAISLLPGYDEGAWWVQDAGAALPVEMLGNLEGLEVYDLCAAPGGKTAQLAARGAKVVAIDRSPARIKRLEANLTRLSLKATTVCTEVSEWAAGLERGAAAIFLDAPCTATGTLRRHPDVALHRLPADVSELAVVQDRLLDDAVRMLKPGGLLVYSTCSLQPEEGPLRIEAALKRNAGLRRAPITPAEVFGQSPFVTARGDLRTLPCHLSDRGGIDGFYACRLILEPN